jgi:hypothetical protein
MQRLKDRGFRKNDPNYRKQVFMYTEEGSRYVLTRIVDPKYEPLFLKNIQAYKLMNEHGFRPLLVRSNEELLEFTTTYEGEEINTQDYLDPDKLRAILMNCFGLVRDLNLINRSYGTLSLPVYLQNFLSLTNENRSFMIYLRDALLRVQGSSISAQLGFGISDPVLSNFVVNNNGSVSLIDLDNLELEQDVLYSAGFLFEDIASKAGSSILQENDILDRVYSGEESDSTHLRYSIGRLSRLVIQINNDLRGIRTEYPIADVERKISSVLEIIDRST